MLRAHAVILTFISLFFFHAAFAGSDGFSAIRCDAHDIAKTLIGKKMSNERIVDLEKRHEDLGLKDLGAQEISERLSCISWLICGSEFMLLQDKLTVRDVLKVPAHSKKNRRYSSAHAILTGKKRRRSWSPFWMLKPKAARRRFQQKSRGRSTRNKENLSAYPPKDFAVRAAVSVALMAVSSAIMGIAILDLLLCRHFRRGSRAAAVATMKHHGQNEPPIRRTGG